MDNPEECKVCFENYDETSRRPRTLPCGHTYCSPCIGGTIKHGQLSCPGCRASHSAAHPTQFPINYGMEALVRKLRAVQLVQNKMTTPSAPQLPDEECTMVMEISGDSWLKLQLQKSKMGHIIDANQESVSQLDQYRAQLDDWKTQHCHLLDRLTGIVEQNKVVLEMLKQEETRVLGMKKEGEERRKQVKDTLGCIEAVSTTQEADAAIVQAERCNEEAETWMQKCQHLFPDVNTITMSCRVREVTRAIVETQDRAEAAVEQPTLQGPALQGLTREDPSGTIMQRVDRNIRNASVHTNDVTAEELRMMRQPVKSQVEAGQVFGIHRDQDRLRSSRITTENGYLYLHCLQDQPPPPNAHTLEVSELVGSLDPSSTLVFLDLCWTGSPRRIHIRLSPDTPLARQFVLLCTGIKGPSYIKSSFIEVGGFRRQGEFVIGGDYENNDGTGGVPLFSDLHGSYRVCRTAGAVWSRWGSGDRRSAQFCITTRDCKGNIPRVFGMVEDGLDVVRAAVNHTNIKDVMVADCGIVLARKLFNL